MLRRGRTNPCLTRKYFTVGYEDHEKRLIITCIYHYLN